jgi:energy-coupling factor transport system permease protein
MTLSLYTQADTPIHRLHPVVKLVAMLGLFTTVFLTDTPHLLAPILLIGLTVAAWAKSLSAFWRLRTLFVLVFVMTFVVWTLFYQGGTPLVQWGPIGVSGAALVFALGMGLKLLGFLTIGVLFLATTKVEEFAYALTRVGVPFKLSFTMTLAFRLVPVFVDASMTVVQAQRCRGFNFDEGNVVQRIRRYVPVIVPVFIGALRRADGMAMALEARGFQSGRQRTALEEYRFLGRDGFALALVIVITTLYIVLWRLGSTVFAAV